MNGTRAYFLNCRNRLHVTGSCDSYWQEMLVMTLRTSGRLCMELTWGHLRGTCCRNWAVVTHVCHCQVPGPWMHGLSDFTSSLVVMGLASFLKCPEVLQVPLLGRFLISPKAGGCPFPVVVFPALSPPRVQLSAHASSGSWKLLSKYLSTEWTEAKGPWSSERDTSWTNFRWATIRPWIRHHF